MRNMYVRIGCGVLLIGILLVVAQFTKEKFSGQALTTEQVDIGGPFQLTNQFGDAVSDQDFDGKLRLVFFGFSNCPAVCPTGLTLLSNVMDHSDDTAVVPLFITLDPVRDTEEVLYKFSQQFHPSIQLLTGSEEAISKVAGDFKVYVERMGDKEKNDYMLNHSSFVYLLGPTGNYLTHFSYRDDAVTVLEELAHYF
jgi:protein SCO1/2